MLKYDIKHFIVPNEYTVHIHKTIIVKTPTALHSYKITILIFYTNEPHWQPILYKKFI